jgi:hypothetical protein
MAEPALELEFRVEAFRQLAERSGRLQQLPVLLAECLILLQSGFELLFTGKRGVCRHGSQVLRL